MIKRNIKKIRPDWVKTVEDLGFSFHSCGKKTDEPIGTYWDESIYYTFDLKDVEILEKATEELHEMCLHVVKNIDEESLNLFVPKEFQNSVISSIKEEHPHLYGRMDLAYDGINPPKLLEYNADTPTTLIESSIIQWNWLQEEFPKKAESGNQFNSIHEKLIDRFKFIKTLLKDNVLHFSSIKNNLEEFSTVEYLRDLAVQADINTKFIHMEDISITNYNLSDDSNPITHWFKLYPWEWLVKEEFGKYLISTDVGIIEPLWKMILSNKILLTQLWKHFPNHPYLLEAYLDEGKTPSSDSWVKKPALGREGGNISIINNNILETSTTGIYDKDKFVYQRKFELPRFDNQYMMLGSWVIGDEAAGILIRENDSPIITNTSKVVPHYFND